MSSTTSSVAEALPAQPGKAMKKWGWGPLGAVLIVVLSFLVSQVVGYLVISIYPEIKHWDSTQANNWISNSTGAQFIYVLISEVMTLTILWAFIRKKVSFPQLGLKKGKLIDLAYFVGGVIAYFVLYILAIGIISFFIHINTSQQQDIGFNDVSGLGATVMTFISLVILPPIVEEITFRGFLFGALRQRFNFIIGAVITSSLFAIPHLLESDSGQGLLWIAGIDTFVLSLVLCYLREKSGRLWASMGVHALKNGVAFIYLFIVHVH